MNIKESIAVLFHHSAEYGLSGIYQFSCSSLQVWIDTTLGTCVRDGFHHKPDVTITIAEQDLINVFSGSADIEKLYATGHLTIDGDIGLATVLPQLILRQLKNTQNIEPIANNRRYSAHKRFSEIISAERGPILEIERRGHEDFPIEHFQSHYVKLGIPLIINGAITDWPLSKTSKLEILTHVEGLKGIIRQGNYADQAFSNKRKFKTVSMVDFLKSIDTLEITSSRNELPAYLGNNILPDKLLELIKYPPLFNQEQYIPPRIWIGPNNTLTPLHRDDTDNLFVQIWGAKRFILAAPHHRAALGTWSTSSAGGLDGCDFDPETPDYFSFPNARNVNFLIFDLRPGQMLYLPEGWFHQVKSLTASLSINFWTNSFRHQ